MPRKSVFDMEAARVYEALVAKAERKGRTRAEVNEVACWLLGYTTEELAEALAPEATYGAFLAGAPSPNPKATLITGKICGVRVEEIEDPLTRRMRQLDKLVDELARGRAMDKVLRA